MTDLHLPQMHDKLAMTKHPKKNVRSSGTGTGILMDVIKKIANMNGNNIFITADHGSLPE
ncbi:MAG: PglZ domain-containing protein [Bacteroidales bacterium]|nr:PglZ domain-containing protein [Bacteroidales bacterium]